MKASPYRGEVEVAVRHHDAALQQVQDRRQGDEVPGQSEEEFRVFPPREERPGGQGAEQGQRGGPPPVGQRGGKGDLVDDGEPRRNQQLCQVIERYLGGDGYPSQEVAPVLRGKEMGLLRDGLEEEHRARHDDAAGEDDRLQVPLGELAVPEGDQEQEQQGKGDGGGLGEQRTEIEHQHQRHVAHPGARPASQGRQEDGGGGEEEAARNEHVAGEDGRDRLAVVGVHGEEQGGDQRQVPGLGGALLPEQVADQFPREAVGYHQVDDVVEQVREVEPGGISVPDGIIDGIGEVAQRQVFEAVREGREDPLQVEVPVDRVGHDFRVVIVDKPVGKGASVDDRGHQANQPDIPLAQQPLQRGDRIIHQPSSWGALPPPTRGSSRSTLACQPAPAQPAVRATVSLLRGPDRRAFGP